MCAGAKRRRIYIQWAALDKGTNTNVIVQLHTVIGHVQELGHITNQCMCFVGRSAVSGRLLVLGPLLVQLAVLFSCMPVYIIYVCTDTLLLLLLCNMF